MIYLMLILIMPLEALADQYLIFIVIQAALFLYMLGYLLLAIKRTYNNSWFKSVSKFLLLMLSYLCIVFGSIILVQDNLIAY